MDHADRVATIARQYAERRRYHIPHTGHTVHRLLDAVSALLGQRVTLEAHRVQAAATDPAPADPKHAPLQL